MLKQEEDGHGKGATSDAAAPFHLDTEVERNFVIRAAKRGVKRGGMGAVRIRETYLRNDSLLVAMSDTVLGGSSTHGLKMAQRTYVCPSAEFLHCYLELFDRPALIECFRDSGHNGGSDQDGIRRQKCSLLLLYSELAKLTGASGALSIRQERRLIQLARSLPGTLVFFDKFCPGLYNRKRKTEHPSASFSCGRHSESPDNQAFQAEDEDFEDDSATGAAQAELVDKAQSSSVVAACEWCRSELGVASVTVLTDDGYEGYETDDNSDFASPSATEALLSGEDKKLTDAEDFWGPSGRSSVRPPVGDGVRIVSFAGFLRRFVAREQNVQMLEQRGGLLRSAYLASKAELSLRAGRPQEALSETGDAAALSPLLMPHPSTVQLEAMVAAKDALKGRLDVFEHNPKEGVVLVYGMGSLRKGDAMDEWTDSKGRGKVLVLGREGMNRSMHGDTVAVRLLPKRRWRAPTDRKRLTHVPDEESGADGFDGADSLEASTGETEGGSTGDQGGNAPPGAIPTGVVVGVIEEGRRPYVVTIPADEGPGSGGSGGGAAVVLTVPMDPRVPKIRVKTRQLAQLMGHRLVVMVDEWEIGSVFPSGHYVQTLGPVGEVSSEAAALLVECEASFEPFSFNALASLPWVPHPPKESQKPRDILLPPATLASRERPEDGFGRAPRFAPSAAPVLPQPAVLLRRWEDSGWRVQESDLIGRRDLRGVRSMSVDPPGCQDIDDAMHVRRRPDGKLEVGVHIADVTAFLSADGSLDREARSRATTVYLVHRRIDMLPSLLSSDLCSLHAGNDRLSVSVVWEVEEDGEDVNISKRPDGSPVCWFGRSAIHSVASMTYDQAQMLVEEGKISRHIGHNEPPPGQAGRDVDPVLHSDLTHDLRLLTRFARTTRKERTKNGAIDLSNTGAELKFKIDPITGTPSAVAGKEESEIHHTIAELMILANSCVAEKIQTIFPSASLVRVHTPPDPSKLSVFDGVAAKVGAGSTEGLAASLASMESVVENEGKQARAGRGAEATSKAGLLKSLAVRAMSEAEYVSTGTLSEHQSDGKGTTEDRFGHFGLGLSHYTHFTSPIRRYADIVVHRLLMAALADSKISATSADATTKSHPEGTLSVVPGGHDSALPASLAPSVMEMEEAVIGKEAADAAASNARLRAGAGDASFVTNPDGTRTYSKVSTSSLPKFALEHDQLGKSHSSRSSPLHPLPEMNAFPALQNLPVDDDNGDAFLDALLGMGTPVHASVVTQGAGAGLLQGSEDFSSSAKGNKESGGNSTAWGKGRTLAFDADTTNEGGDSLVDALLDMNLDEAESNPIEDDAGDTAAAEIIAGQSGTADESNAGELDAANQPPFGGAELGKLCLHLNDRNRKAKRLAQRCQEMFLRLFFKDHSEEVQGLVLSLRSNGFIAYIPAFDIKGPVYLCDKDGLVQVDPTFLGLSETVGAPPSKGFAALPSCKAIPGATVSLTAAVSADKKQTKFTSMEVQEQDPEEVLEIRPPPKNGSRNAKVLRLSVLDGITLRLSCEVLPTQARLPKIRFLLAGVGNAKPRSSNRNRKAQKDSSFSRRKELHKAGGMEGGDTRASSPALTRRSTAVGNQSEVGLYDVLQNVRGKALNGVIESPRSKGLKNDRDGRGDTNESLKRSDVDQSSVALGNDMVLYADDVEEDEALQSPLSQRNQSISHSARKKSSTHRQSKKDKRLDLSRLEARSEIGAGRALFGGFVPTRHAPAASLYDFGSTDGSTGAAASGSIYGNSYNHGDDRSGPNGGGTLGSLDDARIRQYTQEATARSQRLGAEKRNARVSTSKRQG